MPCVIRLVLCAIPFLLVLSGPLGAQERLCLSYGEPPVVLELVLRPLGRGVDAVHGLARQAEAWGAAVHGTRVLAPDGEEILGLTLAGYGRPVLTLAASFPPGHVYTPRCRIFDADKQAWFGDVPLRRVDCP